MVKEEGLKSGGASCFLFLFFVESHCFLPERSMHHVLLTHRKNIVQKESQRLSSAGTLFSSRLSPVVSHAGPPDLLL